jgi:hypothetical protein
VPAWTVESYTSIPPHLHGKSLPRFSLTFGGVAMLEWIYNRRASYPIARSETSEGSNYAGPYSDQS